MLVPAHYRLKGFSDDAQFGGSQSIKCSECGKVFKNTALANYHAEKSGHDQFEESAEEVRRARDFAVDFFHHHHHR